MNSLEDLGRAVAKRQDQAAERLSEQVVRETLRRSRTSRPKPAWRWSWVLGPAAVAIALLLFALLRKDVQPADPPQVASAPQPVPSALTAAAEDGAFVFEDGTTVLLAMGGQGQVIERNDLGGRVRLQQGRMRISVPPERGRRWEFLAGPYLVEVKGTRFDLTWEPKSERFDLEMLDGSVRVSGGEVEPRLVVAGQRLEFGAKPESAVSPPSPAPTAQALSNASASATVVAPSTSKPSPSNDQPNWQALALEGKYKQAVEAAESAGFDGVLARSSASELLLLGDACRLGGKSSLGVRAYTKVRERFAGSLEAQRALFSLGVAAFPSASAGTFFEQYLAEAPNGTLAPEALGRLLEIQHRGSNKQAARAAASRYLARFPNGAHARLAKTILDEAAP